jgi:hypothetical protein
MNFAVIAINLVHYQINFNGLKCLHLLYFLIFTRRPCNKLNYVSFILVDVVDGVRTKTIGDEDLQKNREKYAHFIFRV